MASKKEKAAIIAEMNNRNMTQPKTTVAKKALRQWPPVEQFTDGLLKELRVEFEAVMQAGDDPERLEELRSLGKAAQTYLKALRSGTPIPPPTAPEAEEGVMTAEEIEHLATQMNEVMTLVPPLDAAKDDIMERIIAELNDINIHDFYPNADYPEKKIFDEPAKALIRLLGTKIPGEEEKKMPAVRVPKKLMPSARQVIYKAWMAGEKDAKVLFALVNEAVKLDTIRTYLSDWGKGKYLPAGVPVPEIKDGKAVTKEKVSVTKKAPVTKKAKKAK